MTYQNPFTREVRAGCNLLNAIPFRACVDGSYGDEDNDYNRYEHLISWLRVTGFYIPKASKVEAEVSAVGRGTDFNLTSPKRFQN